MNKFMKKIMSKKDGFTLVELIVVIAILAILAGVAVPVYSGYIAKANAASDQQEIEAIETAMSAALAMEGKSNADAGTYFTATFNATTSKLTVSKNTTATTEIGTRIWNSFTQFYGKTTVEVELKYYNAVTGNTDTTKNGIPALLGKVSVGEPSGN